jgi:hypothetical protein
VERSKERERARERERERERAREEAAASTRAVEVVQVFITCLFAFTMGMISQICVYLTCLSRSTYLSLLRSSSRSHSSSFLPTA